MVSTLAQSASVPRAEYHAEPANRTWILPMVFALGALAVRLWCFTGLIVSDDVVYAHYAHAIVQGDYALEARNLALRFGLLLPVAATYAVLGISEAATVLVPLLASTAAVVLVFFIARRRFGVSAGVIAAVLMATFPLSIRFGSILVPEPIAELYILIAIWCYLSAAESNRAATAIAAGVSLGLACLTRELAFFVVLAVLMDAALQKRWRLLLTVGLGSFAVLAGEQLYYWYATGDPFFRLHAMSLHNQRPTALVFLDHEGWRFFRAIPHMMLVPSLAFGLHSIAALALAVAASFTLRRRQVALFILWAVIPLLYLNFGTTSFKTYIAMPLADRYLELIYPPLFILSGALLALVLKIKYGKIVVTLAVTLLAISGVLCAHATRASGWRSADALRLRAIAKAVQAEGGAIVVFEGPVAWRWKYAMEVIEPAVVSLSSQRGCVLRPDSEGLPVCAAAQP